jgi:hypothetical protein
MTAFMIGLLLGRTSQQGVSRKFFGVFRDSLLVEGLCVEFCGRTGDAGQN